jgi:hypothetical protein
MFFTTAVELTAPELVKIDTVNKNKTSSANARRKPAGVQEW